MVKRDPHHGLLLFFRDKFSTRYLLFMIVIGGNSSGSKHQYDWNQNSPYRRADVEGAFPQILPEVPFKVEPEIRDSWG
jgi:hypothetical protein